jgi:hypothetical protein
VPARVNQKFTSLRKITNFIADDWQNILNCAAHKRRAKYAGAVGAWWLQTIKGAFAGCGAKTANSK